MDTKALEKFCPWACVELIEAVHVRCVRYALDEAGRASYPKEADAINGYVLSISEKAQRQALYERIEQLNAERDGKGYAAFCEQQAYSWFNRFAAIRFMELHGYLSCGVRMLSATDGSFDPKCLHLASELELPGLDQNEVLTLITESKDEELYRKIMVAQCNELAECLPTVFDHVDDAYALTLPDNLLAHGEHDVLFHLVTDIPEEVWNPESDEDNVEVLGWMYQFYNSELKDAFFKSKRKAAVEDLAPATQLFTPDWIVRYMVENSLGRLWMLNNPGSSLREHMAYYIEPDAEHEDYIRIASPEDITFCDPACGSGHILVYAFSLLFEMYRERGYREREIPEFILTKNLSGMEIDERAAQIASLALALCARAHDRRFFSRNIIADVCVLKPVQFKQGALPRALENKQALVEALEHLDEVGSLLAPTSADLAALDTALAELPAQDIFSQHTRKQIQLAMEQCEVLTRSFNVVVANPPYMGSSSFNPFMSKWIKANYPDYKTDLFSVFISRIGIFCKQHGEVGIMSPFVWMFIGSYEKLRNQLIDEKTLTSLIQLEYSGFAGATVPICTFTYHNSHIKGYKGGYVRLSDFVGANIQAPKTLEAIQNPDCGWFYRADATTFHDIPGSPIAYWASKAIHDAFRKNTPLDSFGHPRVGIQTGENARFLRLWWEIEEQDFKFDCTSPENCISSRATWFPYNKGGEYRKWYGNNDYVIDWFNDGERIIGNAEVDGRKVMNLPQPIKFQPSITWSKISSGNIAFRYKNCGHLFDVAGTSIFADADTLRYIQGTANSSVILKIASMLSPTLNFEVGQIATYPIIVSRGHREEVCELVQSTRTLSQADWDTQETSWDFKRCPLI